MRFNHHPLIPPNIPLDKLQIRQKTTFEDTWHKAYLVSEAAIVIVISPRCKDLRLFYGIVVTGDYCIYGAVVHNISIT